MPVPIPYGRQTIEDDDIAAVVAVLRGDWLTQGPAVTRFEDDFATACDAPHAVAFSSGTAALHAAAFAAGAGAGTELLTSGMTFAASANCGAYLGATPTFADIDPRTLNVTPATLAERTTERTRVAVPVHFTGLPAPMAEIREQLPDSVRIVEDAAHALGARSPDEVVGSCRYSDMAVFSLHPVKAIATGEGGVVTTRDDELAELLQTFRNHGFRRDPAAAEREGGWFYEQQLLGFNYRLTDIQSALGSSQLPKAARFIARRNQIAARYRELLAGVEEIELPPAAPERSVHGYHLFAIRVKAGAEARRAVYERLREREIFTQVHYIPPYLHPWYRRQFGYGEGLCPEAERWYSQCLSLPCFPRLTEDEQDHVVGSLREALTR